MTYYLSVDKNWLYQAVNNFEYYKVYYNAKLPRCFINEHTTNRLYWEYMYDTPVIVDDVLGPFDNSRVGCVPPVVKEK
jgi:hypothetical protein